MIKPKYRQDGGITAYRLRTDGTAQDKVHQSGRNLNEDSVDGLVTVTRIQVRTDNGRSLHSTRGRGAQNQGLRQYSPGRLEPVEWNTSAECEMGECSVP